LVPSRPAAKTASRLVVDVVLSAIRQIVNVAFLFFQSSQLEPRHSRHADVNDQTRGRFFYRKVETGWRVLILRWNPSGSRKLLIVKEIFPSKKVICPGGGG
jgi:hypothetical protein